MSYILLSENCRGNRIDFLELEGELFQKSVGKRYYGTLALQTFDDRDYMRITFADGKSVIGGAIKKIMKMAMGINDNDLVKVYQAGNEDYLCHFDFSEKELKSGKKKIKYSIQLGFPPINVLACYDFTNLTGCAYLLPDEEEAKRWAKMLGITEVEYLDFDGKVANVGRLD